MSYDAAGEEGLSLGVHTYFAEEAGSGADNIHEQANNIRQACIRVRHVYGGTGLQTGCTPTER